MVSVERAFSVFTWLENSVSMSMAHESRESEFTTRERYRIGIPTNRFITAMWDEVSRDSPGMYVNYRVINLFKNKIW